MTTPGSYQVGILGRPDGHDTTLIAALGRRLTDLGIDHSSLAVLLENEIAKRDRKKPFIGVFFGYNGADDANHPIWRICSMTR
jgi:hypothetical protein